jgi:hypothetical protein
MNIKKNCFDCVESTWNWQKFAKCIGSGKNSVELCDKFVQINPEEAKKRLEVLGPPGI